MQEIMRAFRQAQKGNSYKFNVCPNERFTNLFLADNKELITHLGDLFWS